MTDKKWGNLECLRELKEQPNKWDLFFYLTCKAVSINSPCLSRKVGAVLALDKYVVSTGYNGPPKGIPHCGHDRFMKDDELSNVGIGKGHTPQEIGAACPRKLLGFRSGEGKQWCTAQCAERNAISNAASLGTSVVGTTLYMNSIIPCQQCFGALINVGVREIVVETTTTYDKFTSFLMANSAIIIREFNLEVKDEHRLHAPIHF